MGFYVSNFNKYATKTEKYITMLTNFWFIELSIDEKLDLKIYEKFIEKVISKNIELDPTQT